MDPAASASRYIVGVDGISLFMVAITALLFPLGLLASEKYIDAPGQGVHRVVPRSSRGRSWGSSSSLDLIAVLRVLGAHARPHVLPHPRDGGASNREYAAMKFFLYTAAGSALLLASTLALGVPPPGRHRRAHLRLPGPRRRGTACRAPPRCVLFLGFMAAFAIKAPLFPFHTWLPDRAHRGADRGLGGAGRRDPQDGRVRLRCGSRSSCSRRRRSTSRRSCSCSR